MKVCIVGAGAIGGFIGARLAAAGRSQVSAIARSATLHALREHGWRLRLRDGDGDRLMRSKRIEYRLIGLPGSSAPARGFAVAPR